MTAAFFMEDTNSLIEQRRANLSQDRGDVENVFSRYMHYHNAFEDERIIAVGDGSAPELDSSAQVRACRLRRD